MIKTLTIEGFRTVPKTELKLDKVNVFSGDYSRDYLDAIGILSAAASGVVDYRSLKKRGVISGGGVPSGSVKIGIITDSTKVDVVFSHESKDKRAPWLLKGDWKSLGDGTLKVLIESYKIYDIRYLNQQRKQKAYSMARNMIEKLKLLEKKDKVLKERREYLDSRLPLFGINNSILNEDNLYHKFMYYEEYDRTYKLRITLAFLLVLYYQSPYLAIDGIMHSELDAAIDIIREIWAGGQLFIARF